MREDLWRSDPEVFSFLGAGPVGEGVASWAIVPDALGKFPETRESTA